MRIETTVAELQGRGVDLVDALDALGISEWAIAEGQLDPNEKITVTEAQAIELGLIPRPKVTTPEPTLCAHCGRTCGDMSGGSASVEGQPVCHPNIPDRPDCYRLVTIHHEVLGSRL